MVLLVVATYPHNRGSFILNIQSFKMLQPKENVSNENYSTVGNTSNSTKTISLIAELVKLNYDFAMDIQSFFTLIEDKVFWMLNNPSDNPERELHQILSLSRTASTMIDPDSFENLQNYLQELKKD